MTSMDFDTKPRTNKGPGDSTAPTSRAQEKATKKFRDPVQRELDNRRAQALFQVLGRLFPQWLRTLVAAAAWIVLSPLYVMGISPYSTYIPAQMATVGMVVCSAMLLHVWPPRTAPWRTLAWQFVLSSFAGSSLLLLDLGTLALTGASLVGFGVLAFRVNQTGRKLFGLVRDWRQLR